MDGLNHILTWEPLVSLLAIIGGWLWAAWEWFSGRKDRRKAEAQHAKLLAEIATVQGMMRQMIGKPESEQRRIAGMALGRPQASTDPEEIARWRREAEDDQS